MKSARFEPRLRKRPKCRFGSPHRSRSLQPLPRKLAPRRCVSNRGSKCQQHLGTSKGCGLLIESVCNTASFLGRSWLNSFGARKRRLRSRRRRRASGWLCRRGSLQALFQKLFAARRQFFFRNLTGIDIGENRALRLTSRPPAQEPETTAVRGRA
jgi:hypothetical protein